jgi:tetratricopeptide (TPR) repeat protein
MPHRLSVRRVVAWLDRFRHPDQQIVPIQVPTSRPIDDNTGRAALAPCPLPREVEDKAAIPTPSTPLTRGIAPHTAPVPVDSDPGELTRDRIAPHHAQGLRMAAAQRWSWAQRELELAVRSAPGGPAAADLASVREARRQLRVLRKWPRDVPAQLALGRCYFELGLGAEAEALFRRVLDLAPTEAAAPYFLALEYAYRGEQAEAEEYYARARALAPDLPPFAVFMGGQDPNVPGDRSAL